MEMYLCSIRKDSEIQNVTGAILVVETEEGQDLHALKDTMGIVRT